MFMLSAVIVGVTLGVQNQRPAEGNVDQHFTHPADGSTFRVSVPAHVSISTSFVPGVWDIGWATTRDDFNIQINTPSYGWDNTSNTVLRLSVMSNGERNFQSGTNVGTVTRIGPVNVITTATLRRTDTNATTPWFSAGLPNQDVTINPTLIWGTPTPPANHEFVGWSPSTRTVNRGAHGVYHGTLDFTPIFTPLAPTIYLATFHLHGGNIDGATAYTNPIVSGMRTPQPRDPVRPNYKFTGWFTQQYGGDPFNFLQPRTSNQTIHAQWEQETRNIVQLHFAGGLAHNETVWHFDTSRPETLWLPSAEIMNLRPPVTGQVFLGWFDNMERVGMPVVMVDAAASGPQNFFARWG